jgi:hypothetical protein
MGKCDITIEVDDARLASYQDAQLAMLWHLGQANPGPPWGPRRWGAGRADRPGDHPPLAPGHPAGALPPPRP